MGIVIGLKSDSNACLSYKEPYYMLNLNNNKIFRAQYSAILGPGLESAGLNHLKPVTRQHH